MDGVSTKYSYSTGLLVAKAEEFLVVNVVDVEMILVGETRAERSHLPKLMPIMRSFKPAQKCVHTKKGRANHLINLQQVATHANMTSILVHFNRD